LNAIPESLDALDIREKIVTPHRNCPEARSLHSLPRIAGWGAAAYIFINVTAVTSTGCETQVHVLGRQAREERTDEEANDKFVFYSHTSGGMKAIRPFGA
jgi:hypothetical protein